MNDIPRTKSGKIVELAVKNIIEGNNIKNKEALANPEILKEFKNINELKKLMLKEIVQNLEPSSTLKINELSKKLEFEGKKFLDLDLVNHHFQVPDDIVEELKKMLIRKVIYQCRDLKI